MLRSALRNICRTRHARTACKTAGDVSKKVDPRYGHMVFTDSKLKQAVGPETYKAFRQALVDGNDLPKAQRNEVSKAILEWALAHGATQVGHLFYPIRGNIPAYKYDGFIDLEFGSKDWTTPLPITPDLVMSASKLLFAESDGSSYPSGGMRVTHEAAAYSAWDRASPVFIRDNTLWVPAVFVTWEGRSQDEKTPLLRSQRAISEQGVRLLHHLGYKDVKDVVCNVGCEQEFFLISREMYERRPDLMATGRTLIGAPPALGQQFAQNYFARPARPVREYMLELQKRLWELNISMIVCHNEVAPSQYEWSPIFTITNIASDQNLLAHEVMQDLATEYGLVCLLHEKPFKGLNGSGKHNNWGLNTDNGRNLYVPGDNEKDQACFIANVAVLARAVKTHGDLLRCGVATPQNDLRLGAQEAPPGIMSLYVGKKLEEFCRKASKGGPLSGYGKGETTMPIGTPLVPPIPKPLEDRNRTAPFPWCGNRFEFRAVGSSQNISWPIAILHTIVADSMRLLSDRIEKGTPVEKAVREFMTEGQDALFSGNNYDLAWHKEAVEKRGLHNIKNTYDAVCRLSDEKNKKVFESEKVLDRVEVEARQEILFENYVGVIELEAKTLLEMLNTGVLPSLSQDLTAYATPFSGAVQSRTTAYSAVEAGIDDLQNAINNIPHDASLKDQAKYCAETLRPQLFTTRESVDAAERLCSKQFWPFPSYTDILYDHHNVGPSATGHRHH